VQDFLLLEKSLPSFGGPVDEMTAKNYDRIIFEECCHQCKATKQVIMDFNFPIRFSYNLQAPHILKFLIFENRNNTRCLNGYGKQGQSLYVLAN